jgi:DNA recombination protein RmuC
MVFVAVGILYVLAGIAVGGLAAFFLCDRRARAEQDRLRTAAALADQRATDLAQQLRAEKSLTAQLRESAAQSELQLASTRAQFQAAQQNLHDQRKLLDDAQLQLREAFASASGEALARNNEAFLQLARERFATISAEAAGSLDQRKEQIDALLKPMREVMEQYNRRVGEIEKSRVESYSMLREQLGTLAESQRTLNTQTSQLVSALSRPTVRGQWGEISLRRLVELAGLSARCDFVEQTNVTTDQGRLRPDMVVNLPGGRDVIIDCKTSLEAFLDASAATDEDTRRAHLQRHAQHLRTRARELSAKSYWAQFAKSPEYVVMFLPGEAFLYAAVEQDASIIEDALKNRVIISTPTTLIALLKAIEFGWRQEAVAENAEQIRQLGTDLYDRVGTVLSHVTKLGASLTQSVSHYNATLASLETRVLVTARKMGDLGAKTPKTLDEPPQVDHTCRTVAPDLIQKDLFIPEDSPA